MSSRTPISASAGTETERWRQLIIAGISAGRLVTDPSLEPGERADESTWPRVPAAAIRAALLDGELRPDPAGLRFRNVVITGRLDLAFLRIDCRLQFRECRFEQGPVLSNASVPRLDLSGSTVPALAISGATFRNGLLLADMTCATKLTASLAQIDVALDLDGAHLGTDRTKGAVVLDLSGAQLRCLVSLRDARIIGDVVAIEADARHQIQLERTEMTGRFTLDGARVGSTMQAIDLTLDGEFRAVGTSFEGDLDFTGATMNAPGGDAISLQRAQVDGTLFFDVTQLHGTLDAPNLRATTIDIERADFSDPDGDVIIRLDGAAIGTLRLCPATVRGRVSLVRASIDAFTTNEVFPESHTMDGIRVQDLHGPMRTDPALAATWLDRADGSEFAPQPWYQIADFYDRIGQPSDARYLRVGAAARVTRRAPRPTRVARRLYAALVGYGYRPLRPFLWLAVVSAVSIGCVLLATGQAFIPSAPTAAAAEHAPSWCPERITAASPKRCVNPSYTEFEPLTAALTLVTPAGAVSNPAWVPGQLWLVLALTAIKLAGWLLTALLLAGITGLLRKQ